MQNSHSGRTTRRRASSLDAVHIAAALDLGGDHEGLVSYDDRLASAADASAIVVVSPR